MYTNSHENEAQFDKLIVSNNNCSYCDKPFSEKLWCKECDPGYDGSLKKSDPEPMKVALKRLNGSRDMSAKYFSEKLAYRCMDAKPNQRPTAKELLDTMEFWHDSIDPLEMHKDNKKYGYYGKEIKEGFEEADEEIPNISISRKSNPDAIYTSRAFTFNNLTKPINSSLITSYLEKDENNE
ncbi:15899_t:CDS:2, partial [Funneliformis mosseae]